MKSNSYSIRHRLKSFQFAFAGLKTLFQQEPNARIHMLAAAIAITAGYMLKINSIEWVAVLICIGLVFAMEIFNTAIEHIANYLTTERNEKIRKIKDLSAAAVLISALTALAVGLVIFLPRLIETSHK